MANASRAAGVFAAISLGMSDQLKRCREKAEECDCHALISVDLAIKMGYVSLALEWHQLAKEVEIFQRRGSPSG
jgi:hypothetical protein